MMERSVRGVALAFSLKALRLNLLEYRFITVIVFAIVLFTVSASLNKAAYQGDLQNLAAEEFRQNAELQDARQYNHVKLGLYRKPAPLSVLSPGARKNYGDVIYVGGLFPVSFPDPRKLKVLSFAVINPLVEFARRIDFPTVVMLLLSLLAVLLVYDAVSGERERGVLKLCLANSLPRYKLILGEHLGALLTLALPIALSIIAFLLIARISPPIPFSADDYVRLAFILALTFLFLSGFVLLGLWVSTLSHTSATSLAAGLCLWAVLAVIYPGSIPSIAKRFIPDSGIRYIPSLRWGQKWDPALDELAWRQQARQAYLARDLSLLMPTTSYVQAVQVLTGTDPIAYVKFVEQGRLLNSRLISWMEDKIRRYPGRDRGYNVEWGPLDISGLPATQYKAETLREALSRAMPNFINLLVFNAICLLGTVASFRKYNPT